MEICTYCFFTERRCGLAGCSCESKVRSPAAMNVSCSEPDQGKKIIEFVARSGYRDEPDLDKYGKPSPRRTTPVHHVAKPDGYIMRDLMQLFVIYNRHDVNYTDESGLSHFHVACRVGCEELVKKFLELGQDPNLLWKVTGDSPLLLALMGCGSSRTAELLMRKGANLNWANKKEITPLHYICGMSADPSDLMKMFFDMNDELNQLVKIDARDRLGNTPLHWAVGKHKNATKSLLRRGANPNSANNAGSTPLHLMSQRVWSVDFVEMFFKINDELNKQVQVDVRDMLGRTPLQLAFCHANKKAAEILLRRGANPNLADEDGLTTLHLICTRDDENDLVEFFFKINDELNQVIQVDAEDKSGRTPLQLAVANLMMNDVDVLLDRGADLSSFVFPNESDFDEGFKWIKTRIAHKSMLASGLMTVVESLEKRGYELDRCEALTIMKLFSKYGLFRKSMDLGKCWYDDEEFATEAKEAMLKVSAVSAVADAYFTLQMNLICYIFESILHIDTFQLIVRYSVCSRGGDKDIKNATATLRIPPKDNSFWSRFAETLHIKFPYENNNNNTLRLNNVEFEKTPPPPRAKFYFATVVVLALIGSFTICCLLVAAVYFLYRRYPLRKCRRADDEAPASPAADIDSVEMQPLGPEQAVDRRDIMLMYVKDNQQFMGEMTNLQRQLAGRTGASVSVERYYLPRYSWWTPSVFQNVSAEGAYEWAATRISQGCRVIWFDTKKARELLASIAAGTPAYADHRDENFNRVLQHVVRTKDPNTEYHDHHVVRFTKPEYAVPDSVDTHDVKDPFSEIAVNTRFILPQGMDNLVKILCT
ncbi:unnamed protein product [Trichogramma brassicae]|uniref:Uncharacterized protein n=1 Tax=Trichogramma brassicae TaxID=86971 RepID=A0A6H5I6V8_9HYME|nr:unnamed protein product [Trichogramma brassicae]